MSIKKPDKIVISNEEEEDPENNTKPDSDLFELFDYSPKSKDGSVKGEYLVRVHDLKTLQYKTWLNSSIVNFYLAYLQHEILPQDEEEGVYIYNTSFYTEKRHLKVKEWTKNVNIFEKNLLIFPICENHHWFLIVVVKPGLVTTPKERNNNGEPLILVLDSLGRHQDGAVSYIRKYLAKEWRDKRSQDCGGQTFKFSEQQIKTVRPKKVNSNLTDWSQVSTYFIVSAATAEFQRLWHLPLAICRENNGKVFDIVVLISPVNKSFNF